MALGLGAAAFLLYLASLYPGLSSYRDAGDMAASAWTLGVAHPPGYPLYVLAGHAFAALVPFGSAAYRLNLLSALAASGAIIWCQVPNDRSKGAWHQSIIPPLVLATAPAFWHLALLSEMYALNALFAAGLLWLTMREEVRERHFYAAALLLGLGIANHQTLLALAPALAWAARGRLTRRGWALCAAFFLAGAAVFLFLPLRSLGEPWLDWGDPETPARLWRVLTRGDYGGVRLHPERPAGLLSAAQWGAGLAHAARVFWAELTPVGALLALWGLWAGRRSRAAQALGLAFFLSGPLFIVWANLDPARPETRPILEPHLVLPLVCATGLLTMVTVTRVNNSLLGVALAGAVLFFRKGDAAAMLGHRDDFTAWDYGTALAAGLPRGALVLDPDDPTAFTLSYLDAAHAKGRHVTPVLYFRTRWGYERLKERHPELLPARELRSGLELHDALISHNLAAGRPVYVDLPQKAPPGLHAVPEGLAYRLSREEPDAAARAAAGSRAQAAFGTLFLRAAPPGAGFFSAHAAAYWSSALNNAAIAAERRGSASEAERLYARALAFDPELPQAWNNWGNAALARGDAAAAEGRYLAALRLKDDGAVRYNLGRAYLLAGRLEDAERAYRASLERGGPVEAANDIGLVHLRAGRTEEAVKHWLDLLRRRPDYALAYYNLGVALERLGRRREAAEAVSAWASLSASKEDRREAAAWLERLKK